MRHQDSIKLGIQSLKGFLPHLSGCHGVIKMQNDELDPICVRGCKCLAVVMAEPIDLRKAEFFDMCFYENVCL